MAQTTRTAWEERIRRWRASGLTGKEFAASEGVAAARLYWWSSKLGQWASNSPAFVEVQLPTSPTESRLEVAVRGEELRIEISPGFDADLLRNVLTLLRSL
jgi:hypothetical protein